MNEEKENLRRSRKKFFKILQSISILGILVGALGAKFNVLEKEIGMMIYGTGAIVLILSVLGMVLTGTFRAETKW